MPVATPISASPHPSSLVKMEERKRPAITSADDLAPPSKRQAVNGGSGKSKDDGADNREEAWIEVRKESHDTIHSAFVSLLPFLATHLHFALGPCESPSRILSVRERILDCRPHFCCPSGLRPAARSNVVRCPLSCSREGSFFSSSSIFVFRTDLFSCPLFSLADARLLTTSSLPIFLRRTTKKMLSSGRCKNTREINPRWSCDSRS